MIQEHTEPILMALWVLLIKTMRGQGSNFGRDVFFPAPGSCVNTISARKHRILMKVETHNHPTPFSTILWCGNGFWGETS